MKNAVKRWFVRDKRRLLMAMMDELAGDAHISFEGNLSALRFSSIPGVSHEETVALKRHTRWPKQDFIVIPLEPSTNKAIISAMGGTVPNDIIHIQVERGGVLQFAAYDNFHPESVVFGTGVEQAVLTSLVAEGIIRPYTDRPPLGNSRG
jgi:hypothetical protein